MKAIFSSNLIEILTQKLKQNIFFRDVKPEVYIFVANKFVKNYLMKNFADDPDLKIAFGLNFVNISNFLNFFQNKLKISKDKRFLNFLELNLIVRKKIIEHIQKPKHLCNNLYLDLKKYLIKDNKIIEKRLTKLCFDLTEIYLKYCIFENEKDIFEKSNKHWQISLFLEIFYEEANSLVFRDLNKSVSQSIKEIQNIEFHFFSISYMPAVYFDFINKFKNVFHYFTSPTFYFFEDLLSNFERKNFKKHLVEKKKSQKQIIELDRYLKDQNPFLANMEKLKRNYLKIVSSYDDIHIYDEYEIFDQNKSNLSRSFLKIFQDDILNLENRENNILSVEKEDSSIQVHVATSKLREIQILYLNILKLMKNDPSLKLSDIHVISKNIDEYASYIGMVFANDQIDLKYKISDLKVTDESFFINGFEKLINLSNSRFEKDDVLDLFENPLFLLSHDFSNDEVKTLFKWIEKANISWGLDETHILKFLKKSDLAILKSFEKGIARIFLSAIFVLNQEFLSSSFLFDYPILELDISDLNILDKFLKTLLSIKNDLEIIENSTCLALDEWQAYLKNLAQKNFKNFQSLSTIIDEEKAFVEMAAFDSFQNYLKDLKSLAFNFDQATFPFEIIFEHLKKHLSKLKIERHANLIEAINFSSFEISYLRAKAIFIIGLDDDAFQIKTKSSIDISNLKDVPTQADHERSLFLQSLLNAKDYLILSYVSKENQKIDKAIFLEEFLSYLDRSYRILNQKPSKYVVKKHPLFSFHKNYFAKDNDSFSMKDYKAAVSYYKEGQNQESIINVKPLNISQNEEIKIVDLQHLKQLCKNPIGFYLNNMDIYLEEDDQISDFQISNLDKYIIKRAATTDSIDDILFSLEKKAKMPIGMFNEIARYNIKSDILLFLQKLKDLKVDYKNLTNIEFRVDSEKIEKVDSHNIIMPPIEVRNGRELIKIVGRIENISNQGLLAYLDDQLYNQIRIWPDILVLNKLKTFEKKVIFTKSKRIKSFEIDRVDDYIIELIKYYEQSQVEISFMIKPFCEHILNEEQSLLEKAFKKIDKKNIFLDVYSTWYFKNFEKPQIESIIEKSKILIKTFYPILEQN